MSFAFIGCPASLEGEGERRDIQSCAICNVTAKSHTLDLYDLTMLPFDTRVLLPAITFIFHVGNGQ